MKIPGPANEGAETGDSELSASCGCWTGSPGSAEALACRLASGCAVRYTCNAKFSGYSVYVYLPASLKHVKQARQQSSADWTTLHTVKVANLRQ